MDVSLLEGSELEYWVARAEGFSHDQVIAAANTQPWTLRYLDWTLGGRILEREKISLFGPEAAESAGNWIARTPLRKISANKNAPCWWMFGNSPLLAAMRAYVASKFGDKVLSQISGG